MQKLDYDSAALYRITVLGRLGCEWSDRLNDMSIVAAIEPDLEAVTVLSGWLADQAALAGVLNTLYDLGLTLRSVERLAQPPSSPGTKPA